MTLVDAGPLVAVIHARDKQHLACSEVLRSLEKPLTTVWPAFTEAMYLLAFSWTAQSALWQFVTRGALTFTSLDEQDAERMHELMEKYGDLPMDLADAALVRVAERDRARRIFTLDQTDFSVYRPRGTDRFELLPESGALSP